MAQVAPVFAGSIPDAYQTYLVPLIFDIYALDLSRRVAALKPGAVLETAAGTGVVTRRLAPQLPEDARYCVTDLNGAMLEEARKRQPPGDRIEWQTADAMALAFAPSTFDAVLCQFGVMFLPDKSAAFAEARRVLKPGGTFFFNVWDRIESNDFPDIVMRALSEVFGDDAPRFMARVPHGYHDTGRIAADLRAAGFTRFEIETSTETSHGQSARDVAIAFCQGTPMRAEIEGRDGLDLEHVTATATEALVKACGEGRITGRIQAHVVTART